MGEGTAIVRANLGSDGEEEEAFTDDLRRVTRACHEAIRSLQGDESHQQQSLITATEELIKVAWQERVFWVDSDRHLADQIRKTEELRKVCMDARHDIDVIKRYLIVEDV